MTTKCPRLGIRRSAAFPVSLKRAVFVVECWGSTALLFKWKSFYFPGEQPDFQFLSKQKNHI